MAKLRDTILPIAHRARAIAGKLGFREHTVALVDTAWSGNHVGDGQRAAIEAPITEADGQPPKVRWLNDQERALANAAIGETIIVVGPITPIGAVLESLARPLENHETRHVKITGPKHPQGALYRVIDVDRQKPLRIMIRAHVVASAT